MSKLTWHNLPVGSKVVWRETKRGKDQMLVGVVVGVGANRGDATFVSVEYLGKTKRLRIRDLEYAR